MPLLPMLAAILLTLSVVIYSIGIWAEFKAKRLKSWHVTAILIAAVGNAVAISLMLIFVGGLPDNGFAYVGIVGLLLMIFHAAWAWLVFRKNEDASFATFHKFGWMVWMVWVLTYLSSAYEGIGHRLGIL